MQLRQNENQLAMLKTSLLNTNHIACHKKEQLHFKSKFSEIEYLTCRVYASAFYFAPHKIHKFMHFRCMKFISLPCLKLILTERLANIAIYLFF